MSLPDEINLGILLVEVKEFKVSVKAEIKKFILLIKNESIDKFNSTLEKNEKLEIEINTKLKEDASSIDQYIEQLLYINGE